MTFLLVLIVIVVLVVIVVIGIHDELIKSPDAESPKSPMSMLVKSPEAELPKSPVRIRRELEAICWDLCEMRNYASTKIYETIKLHYELTPYFGDVSNGMDIHKDGMILSIRNSGCYFVLRHDNKSKSIFSYDIPYRVFSLYEDGPWSIHILEMLKDIINIYVRTVYEDKARQAVKHKEYEEYQQEQINIFTEIYKNKPLKNQTDS